MESSPRDSRDTTAPTRPFVSTPRRLRVVGESSAVKEDEIRLAVAAQRGLRILTGQETGPMSFRELTEALGHAHRYLQYHEISPHQWAHGCHINRDGGAR